MKILTTAQMRALEQAAISAGVDEPAMMRAAAEGIAKTLQQHFPRAPLFAFFCGKGNNGGDGRLAAKLLSQAGCRTRIFSASPEMGQNDEHFSNAKALPPGTVRVDALLGIGFKPPLRAALAEVINLHLQGTPQSPVVAIDVPSGLDADTGQWSTTVVRSQMTIACGPPKKGLFADRAIPVVGKLLSVPLPLPEDAIKTIGNSDEWFTAAEARVLMPKRPWDSSKKSNGHLFIIAGSEDLSGAAVLCARAAVAAGAGLVTVWTPRGIRDCVATSVPEAIVRGYNKFAEIRTAEADALVIGPGWGRGLDRVFWLERLLDINHCPVLLDADALYALSQIPEWYRLVSTRHVLTPHRGEWQRLPEIPQGERRVAAQKFSELCEATVVLKGPCTLVVCRGQPLSWNSSGTPALATGGTGDALAGFCGALLAQGLCSYDAARLGVFLHGLCADVYEADKSTWAGFSAGLIPSLLPKAVNKITKNFAD